MSIEIFKLLFQLSTEGQADSQDCLMENDMILRVNEVWVGDLDDCRIMQIFNMSNVIGGVTLEVRRKETV